MSTVDGGHISSLWITFFYRYLPEIIRNGYLYIALSPIYRVTEKNGKSESFKYFYDDDELDSYLSNVKKKPEISYIKGLGELQPQQLWESTMDPENRHIVKVSMDDIQIDSLAIETCMGDNVELRRNFIMENVDFSKVVD